MKQIKRLLGWPSLRGGRENAAAPAPAASALSDEMRPNIQRKSDPLKRKPTKEDKRQQAKDEKEARVEARELFDLLCKQAETEAQEFREAGNLAAALAVYDN